MQYLKEMPNGNRVPVSPETYMVDQFNVDIIYIIRTQSITVYRIGGQGSRPAMKPLKYGGRGNPKSPSAYRGG